MNMLSMKVIEFRGDDEVANTKMQAVEPTFYDDGTAEIRVDLAGNRSAYIRVNLGELVRLRAETTEVEEAPESQ